MEVTITADENAPKEALAALAKAGILHTLIEKHLRFEGKTDDKWWLQASAKHYLESGKVSGSFYSAIQKIAEEYAVALTQTALKGQIEAEPKQKTT